MTTMHVRNAIRGDIASLSWIIDRLAPLLLAHADYRLGPSLRIHVDPQDLVNEAWMVLLPRLETLGPRDDRYTPVLLKFLTRTITNRIGSLLKARLTRSRERGSGAWLERIPAENSTVGAELLQSEANGKILELLRLLSAEDREIVILRGIEGHSSKHVAQLLEISTSAVDKRYSRALARLRAGLPGSVFDELS